MDPCEALAHSAEILIGQPVERVCFQQMHWLARFDGIWACASLLHVPENQLEEVFQRVCRALKHGGVFYVSFKYGQSERMKEGRLFTDMNEARLKHVVEEVNGCGGCGQMQIVETWLSGDVRSGRSNEQWLNGLLRKTTGKEGKDQDLL
jgi:SAM-dependent methyltransferase